MKTKMKRKIFDGFSSEWKKDAGGEEEVKVINNNKEVNRPFPVSLSFSMGEEKEEEAGKHVRVCICVSFYG